jgi:hypothetical protein
MLIQLDWLILRDYASNTTVLLLLQELVSGYRRTARSATSTSTVLYWHGDCDTVLLLQVALVVVVVPVMAISTSSSTSTTAAELMHIIRLLYMTLSQ